MSFIFWSQRWGLGMGERLERKTDTKSRAGQASVKECDYVSFYKCSFYVFVNEYGNIMERCY